LGLEKKKSLVKKRKKGKIAKKKKAFPFKTGQRVRYKNSPPSDKAYGIIWSGGPAKIGGQNCRIPGGPLILENYVYVTWYSVGRHKGKHWFCMEKIDNLVKC
tara:strand:- start:325 stop:630 length:306 start_codon:yes stop_codon:yes gene_type:complete